jgi:hypothetical protein
LAAFYKYTFVLLLLQTSYAKSLSSKDGMRKSGLPELERNSR